MQQYPVGGVTDARFPGGLHVLGGLWVWGRTVTRLAGGAELIDIRQSVKLCTTYWHYLLLVWLVLFAVLNFS